MVYLKRFALPKTDVRMVTIENKLFKIAIHLVKHPNRTEKSYEEFCSNIKHQEEIEKIITVLLTCKSQLRPIKTDHFTVYPYQRNWKCASSLRFYRHKRLLKNCPFQTHFYIEPKISIKDHIETRKQDTGVQNTTEHPTYHDQASPSNTQKKKTQARKSESQNKIVEPKMYEPNIVKNEQIISKCELGNPPKVYEELESESEDDQSVSILNGVQCCAGLSPEDIGPGALPNSDNESFQSADNKAASLETAKEDIKAEEIKSRQTIKLIFASEGQTRKRHGDVQDEALPKKKNFSVTEYLDTNRHAVQEEELQELLRFQNLATPADEKPAATEERRAGNIREVFSSVKKLVFG